MLWHIMDFLIVTTFNLLGRSCSEATEDARDLAVHHSGTVPKLPVKRAGVLLSTASDAFPPSTPTPSQGSPSEAL